MSALPPLSTSSAEHDAAALAGHALSFYLRRGRVEILALIGIWLATRFLVQLPGVGERLGVLFWILGFALLAELGVRLTRRWDVHPDVAGTAGAVVGLIAGCGIALIEITAHFSGWQLLRLVRDSIGGAIMGYAIAAAFAYIARRLPQPTGFDTDTDDI